MPNLRPRPSSDLVPGGSDMHGGKKLWKQLLDFDVKRSIFVGSDAKILSAFCKITCVLNTLCEIHDSFLYSEC